MRQGSLLPSQVGKGASIDRLDFGGKVHDKIFAWTKTFSGPMRYLGGPMRGVGDLVLVADCAISIIPGPGMAPVIPAAMTATGITLAAPVHAVEPLIDIFR